MAKVKVKLLIARSGPGGAFSAGDEIEVSAAEAGRMFRAGQIENPGAKVLKSAIAAETADGRETAAAAADPETAGGA